MAMKKLNYNTAKSSLDSSQLASVFSNGFTSKPISESEIKMIPLKPLQKLLVIFMQDFSQD